MKQSDNRRLDNTVYDLVRRIRHLILECENHNIDYDEYVDKDDLYTVISILECCLDHKDSRTIIRRDYDA